MKLVAFVAGRRNGNTEIYVKEALMAAEAKGVEVELVRLNDFEVHDCISCGAMFCPANVKISNCPFGKDDTLFLANKFLDSDGVIFASPVYSLTPTSMMFSFRDRVFGPKMDVTRKPEADFVQGRHKNRPGALISVGGCMTEHWTSLGMPNMFSLTFSTQTDVVDHLNVYGIAGKWQALSDETWLARAHKLGENVAEAMLSGDHSWRGEKEGICPSCHLNVMEMVPGSDKVICPQCGIYGKITMKDGKVAVEWPDTPENRQENRLTVEGKAYHMDEIMKNAMRFKPLEEECKQKAKKYTEYNDCVVVPPNKRK